MVNPSKPANPRSVVPDGPYRPPFPASVAVDPPPRPKRSALTRFVGQLAGLAFLGLVIVACVCAAHRLIEWGWAR